MNNKSAHVQDLVNQIADRLKKGSIASWYKLGHEIKGSDMPAFPRWFSRLEPLRLTWLIKRMGLKRLRWVGYEYELVHPENKLELYDRWSIAISENGDIAVEHGIKAGPPYGLYVTSVMVLTYAFGDKGIDGLEKILERGRSVTDSEVKEL